MQPYTKAQLTILSYPEDSVIKVTIKQGWNGSRDVTSTDNIHPKLRGLGNERLTHLMVLRYLKDLQKDSEMLPCVECEHNGHPTSKTIQDIIKFYHQNQIRWTELETVQEVADFLHDLEPKQSQDLFLLKKPDPAIISISFWGTRLIKLGRETTTLTDLIQRISFIAEKTHFVPDTSQDGIGTNLQAKIRHYIRISDNLLKQKNWFTRVVEWIRNHWAWTADGRQPLQKIYEIMRSKLSIYW